MESKTPNDIHPFLEDVALLTQYAREQGLVVDVVEKAQQLINKSRIGPLDPAEVAELTTYFETLSQAAPKVTPSTLHATSGMGEGYWRSAAGRHLIKLWILTFFATLLILLKILLEKRIDFLETAQLVPAAPDNYFWFRLKEIADYLLPFTYGSLGACAYLLRVSAEKLRTREFSPNRIPEHWNRLVLGTLSGGIIVLFVRQPDGLPIAEGAFGFLAGYSIDFLFQTLDRVIAAILPKTGLDTVAQKIEQRKKKILEGRYQERLRQAKNMSEKKILTEIINDLKT